VVVGHLLSTSTFDLLVWTAIILFVARILSGGDQRLWVVVGAVAGVGLENKQLPLLLLLALALGLALDRRLLAVLRSPWLWAGAAVAVALWLPNLLWQATHGWPQLELAGDIREDEAGQNRVTLIPFQLLLVGPLLVPLLAAGLWALLRHSELRRWRALGFAYLCLVFIVLLTGGKPYYIAPLLLCLLAAGAVVAERWLRSSARAVLVGAAILAHYLIRPFRGRWFLRFLVLLPWAAPVALGTIAWLWIFESTLSVVNWSLVHLQTGPFDALGLDLVDPLDPPQWLGRPNLAMASIIAVHSWRILPFATVIFIAGLASIPAEVDDAAKVDGATGIKKLIYVTLPLQLPIALVALLFGIVFTATDITVVYILTNGGPFNQTQMLPMWAFQTGIRASSLGEGAAISLYLLPILVVVSITMLWFARRAEVT